MEDHDLDNVVEILKARRDEILDEVKKFDIAIDILEKADREPYSKSDVS